MAALLLAADHRCRGGARAAAERLAVDGDELPSGNFMQSGDPT